MCPSPQVHYGLYAVVVHSGLTLNGGHYYTFARSSGGRDLSREDSTANPWHKFDDRDVSASSFAYVTCGWWGGHSCRVVFSPLPPPPTVSPNDVNAQCLT